MLFQPLNTLKKDSYISPKWTAKRLNMVAQARRVIGYGGAFPPYKGLVDKFDNAEIFDIAFELYPKIKESEIKIKEIKIDEFINI